MITVKDLMLRLGLMMAAAVLMPLAHAAPSSAGMASDGAVTEAADGMTLYQEHCAACHEGQVPRAPHIITFSMMGGASILNAMNNGVMRAQAAALSATEREVLAAFLAEEPMAPPKPILACSDPMSALASSDAAAMKGWGGNAENHRHSDGAGLDRNNVDQLALKWVFAYPGALRARSQPLVHDGVIFVGSQSGDIYALDLESGCAYWTYSAGAEVRSSLSLGQMPGRDDPVLYMGDFTATVHAIDASDGSLIWRSSVGDHPDATITGSPKLHDGRLYVPLSSSEWATAADPGYACCTFQGGVVAVDASSGELQWRSHVIEEAAVETGEKNPFGAPVRDRRARPYGTARLSMPSAEYCMWGRVRLIPHPLPIPVMRCWRFLCRPESENGPDSCWRVMPGTWRALSVNRLTARRRTARPRYWCGDHALVQPRARLFISGPKKRRCMGARS